MFDRKKVLVIGDFMLDLYTIGDVQRISPEAPVPVLRVIEENRRPGGAGNAILNLISLGMDVRAIGRVGEDLGGDDFISAMKAESVDVRGMIQDPHYRTPLKNRMIASGQQLIRIDHEILSSLNSALEQKVINALPDFLEDIDVVAISDYGKGFLTPNLLLHVIRCSQERNIPVIADPKGQDFSRYYGVTVLKPNVHEAIMAAGLGFEATLDDIAKKIMDEIAIESLMITRAKEGISIFSKGSRHDYPAQIHEVKDVTGAGDTVLAVIAAALANRMEISDAAILANIAAGIAIQRIGCARITLDELEKTSAELKCLS